MAAADNVERLNAPQREPPPKKHSWPAEAVEPVPA